MEIGHASGCSFITVSSEAMAFRVKFTSGSSQLFSQVAGGKVRKVICSKMVWYIEAEKCSDNDN